MNGWRQTRLKYLAATPITNGLGESGQYDDPTWPRYVRTTDIESPLSLRSDVFASLPPEVAARASLLTGDLLMSAAGTIGKSTTYLEVGPACYAGFLARFRPGPEVDGRFIGYWMQSTPYWDQINIGAVRSTIDNFSAGKYRQLELRLPRPEEQRRVADFLDEQVALLDRAIHLRKQQTALLSEAVLSALAQLFGLQRQDRDSVPLGRLLRRPPCYGVLVPVFDDVGVPFIRVNDLEPVSVGRAPVMAITREQNVEYRRTIVEPGDVLTSVVGSLGRSAVVSDQAAGSNIARAVCRLQPVAQAASDFLLGWLSTPQYLSLAERATGSGTAQATLNMGDLVKFPVAVPSDGNLARVGAEAKALSQQERHHRELLQRSLALLEERKHAAITAAVTGEFDVTTASARSVA